MKRRIEVKQSNGKNPKKQRGFTIIELLVATSVFSLILMVALAGILRVTQLYYKGITASRTQEITRSLSDELSESIQFSNNAVILQPNVGPDFLVTGPEVIATADDTNYFCIGSKRFTYAIDRQLKAEPDLDPGSKQKRHVLWVDIPESGCTGTADLTLEQPSPLEYSGREVLGENMRLAKLEIVPETLFGREAYTINISVAYGDHAENDYGGALTTTPDGKFRTCQSLNSPFVGQFCSVSTISVTVERRLQ
jgi:prepilin-type N-terminal cleavage/methylation domain-containing protein